MLSNFSYATSSLKLVAYFNDGIEATRRSHILRLNRPTGCFGAYAALLCLLLPGLVLAVSGGFMRREVVGLSKYAIKPIFSSLVAVRKWSVKA